MNGPEYGRIESRFKGSARGGRHEIPQDLIEMIAFSVSLHDQWRTLACRCPE
jgi:hypothetical protein